MLLVILQDIKIRYVHSRFSGRVSIGRTTNLYPAKGEIHILLKLLRHHTCKQIDNYVKWVLLRDPRWWQSSILCFPFSWASWPRNVTGVMLRTCVAQQRQLFMWLGKSHSPRPIVGRAHHAARSRRAALSRRAASGSPRGSSLREANV